MKQIKIDIVTDDRGYGQALSRALNHRRRSFNITIRGCDEYIDQWKKRGVALRKESDLILWDGEEGEFICSGNIVWIRETEEDPGCGEKGFSIYRYDTVTRIYGRLIDIYRSLTQSADPRGPGSGPSSASGVLPSASGGPGSDPSSGVLPPAPGSLTQPAVPGSLRTIAFVSWQGGSGCTTVCRAVGQELTRSYGKKVLILSLEGVESLEPGPEGADGAFSVDAFLYRLFHRPADMEPEQFFTTDGYGISYMSPSMGRNPLPGLSADEMEKMMHRIMESADFDALLIDAGNHTGDGAAAMIAFANKICCIERTPQRSREKRYMTWLKNSLGTKTETFSVKNGELFKEEQAGEGRSGPRQTTASHTTSAIHLAEMDHVSDISREILLEGDFSNNIHELTEALWYNKN